MKLHSDVDIFIPDSASLEKALERTTHLAIGAHADDLEIFAFHGILECYASSAKWFSGVPSPTAEEAHVPGASPKNPI